MKTFRDNGAWRRFRVRIKETDLEISATISSLDHSHDVVYELQEAILDVFRIHHARKMAEHPKRDHSFGRRTEPTNGHFKPRNGYGDILS